MQTETLDIQAKIAELKQRYTRLALECKAAGIRVSAATIAEYARELGKLETQA